jgi:hypothetical protein
VTEAEFIAEYPRIWHMTRDGAWPGLQARGLLSTSALLDLYGVEGEAREALEARRRATSVLLTAPGLPEAVLRDQGPLNEAKLFRCLDDGLSCSDWLRRLNGQVYFWPKRERLAELLCGRVYRDGAHTILTVDTASLLAAHGERVRLSPINSGATGCRASRRGLSTFRTISDHPSRENGRKTSIAELVVEGAVLDIADHVLAAHRAQGGTFEQTWLRPGAAEDEGP